MLSIWPINLPRVPGDECPREKPMVEGESLFCTSGPTNMIARIADSFFVSEKSSGAYHLEAKEAVKAPLNDYEVTGACGTLKNI